MGRVAFPPPPQNYHPCTTAPRRLTPPAEPVVRLFIRLALALMLALGLAAPTAAQTKAVLGSTGVTVDEGGTATFTVKLSAAPPADGAVTVNFDSNDIDAVTVDTTAPTFTTSDWNTAQEVTVSGVQDKDLRDETVTLTYRVLHHPSSGVAPTTLSSGTGPTVTVTDDEDLEIWVSNESSLDLDEGSTATYTVRLNLQPIENVTVSIVSSDTTIATVSPASLTFTTSNWNIEQEVTVTGVTDDDTNIASTTITHSATGVANKTVWVIVNDSDTGACPSGQHASAFWKTCLTIGKDILGFYGYDGNSNTGTLSDDNFYYKGVTHTINALHVLGGDLTFQASGDILRGRDVVLQVGSTSVNLRGTTFEDTITVAASGIAWGDTNIGDKVSVSLRLSPGADVTGPVLQSATIDGAKLVMTFNERIDATSYGAIDGSDFTVKVNGTEWPLVIAPLVAVTFDGTKIILTLAEAVGPNDRVTVSYSSLDDDDLRDFSGNFILSFFDVPVLPTVARVSNPNNEYVITGVPYWVLSEPCHTIPGEPPVFISRGNRRCWIIANEEGDRKTFGVRMKNAVVQPVTVNIRSDDSDALSVSHDLLTFTPENWDTEQIIAVTGEADSDGLDEWTDVWISGDTGANPDNVRVNIKDNDGSAADPSGLVYSNSCNCMTVRAGDSNGHTFTVRLAAQPERTVTMNWDPLVLGDVRAADNGNAIKVFLQPIDGGPVSPHGVKISPKYMTFTTSNWNTAQTFTVTADSGTLGSTIRLRPWWRQSQYPRSRTPEFTIKVGSGNFNYSTNLPTPLVRADAGDGAIRLTWATPEHGEGITSWQARYGEADTHNGSVDWGGWYTIPGAEQDTTAHTVTGLTNNTFYGFQVRAVAGSRKGNPSVLNFIMPRAGRVLDAPGHPELNARAGNGAADLSWEIPSFGGTITGWQYRYGALDAVTNAVDWGDWTDIADATAETRSYTVTGLVNNTKYGVQVRAVAGDNLGDMSERQVVWPYHPPFDTVEVTEVTSTTITVEWVLPQGVEATGLRAMQRLVSGEWEEAAELALGATSHIFTGLSPETRYNFRIVLDSATGGTDTGILIQDTLAASLLDVRLSGSLPESPQGSSDKGLRSSGPGDGQGCEMQVVVEFFDDDGNAVQVNALAATHFTVENGNGTIGTPVQDADGLGWTVPAWANPGFTPRLMRVLLGRTDHWEASEHVFRISAGETCAASVPPTSLASLALEGMELDPAFDPDTYQYRVTVPNFVTSATLDAQAVYETATVSINREDDDEDVPGHQVALSNIFHVTISVTVGDETQSYYINGSPPPPDDALTGFELVDAATDADLGAIADGDTLSGSATGLYGFRAAVTPGAEIGSVVLTLSGPDEGDTHTQTEGLLPYSLYGDAPGGANGGRAEHGRVLAAGSYTLSATAYAGSGGAGDALDTRSVTFTVEGAATTLPASAGVLTGLVLVDASDNTDLGAIADGDTLSVSSDGTYGIRAGVGQTVGSVVLTLSGPGETDTHTQTESIAPYSLYGDEDDGAGGRTLNGEALPVGSYTLTATAYAERGGAGEVQGTLSVSFEVLEAAVLSVADASATEGTDEALEFVVTLDREATGTVTVSYTTEDGVATAPADYTTTSGTLTFAAGETTQTVSVPIVNDGHDEGSETMTLTLSGATGATITDDRATGTISNDGPIPEAWLARFGRTVTGQVLDAVETRLSATRAVGVEARLAGEALPSSDEAAASLASWLAPAEPDRGLMSQADAPGGVRFETRALTERDFLVGTSFAMTAQAGEGGGFASLWGNASVTGFDGRRANLTLDGEVTTGLIGVDWAADNRVAGLALGHSRGTGNYRDAEGSPGMDGKIEATLTGLYPYAGIDLTDRLSVWAAAGHGTGEVTVTPSGGADLTADLSMSMLAAGLRNEVLRPAGSGLSLAVKGDARFTRTSSDAVDGTGTGTGTSGGNLAAADADVWLLRAGIEGSQTMTLTAGATLTPSFGVGLRLDGGDAETGMGADIGGGLAFADPASGLTLDLKARGLLAHEASGFREWGASIAASWDPRPTTDRGPALSLTQTWGASPSGGMDALLSRETLAGLAADDSAGTFGAAGRLEGELGYGIAMFGGGFTGTPNVGFALSDGGAREWRVGWRLSPGGTARGDFDFGLSLDATRCDPAGGGAPEHAVALKGALRW